MKKILVTGGEGFIGKHLCDALRKQGHNVSSIDIASKENPLDIRDITIVMDFDCVFHLAALSDITDCIVNPTKCLDINGTGTGHLLHSLSMSKFSGSFIFASSSAVYDCANVYAASKRAGEALCRAYNNSFNINTKIARFFNVYGVNQNPNYGAVISNFVLAKLNNKKGKIYGDGEQVRDFIHVDDVVTALISLMETGGSTPYDIGTGIATSINDLASLMDLTIDYESSRIGDPYKSVAKDVRRTKLELEWKPKVSLEEGIKRLTKR